MPLPRKVFVTDPALVTGPPLSPGAPTIVKSARCAVTTSKTAFVPKYIVDGPTVIFSKQCLPEFPPLAQTAPPTMLLATDVTRVVLLVE